MNDPAFADKMGITLEDKNGHAANQATPEELAKQEAEREKLL